MSSIKVAVVIPTYKEELDEFEKISLAQVRKVLGKYPIIFLTFKDVKFDTWKATINKISALLQTEFARHSELASSDRLAAFERTYFDKVVNGKANEVELSSALENLSRMLYKHYEIKPVISNAITLY